MQSYYPPSGLFPRRRPSSATHAQTASQPKGATSHLLSDDHQGQPVALLSPSFAGDLHESPQSQTSSNGSILPTTLHPAKTALNASPRTAATRAAFSQQLQSTRTPETPFAGSEREGEHDFPTVSQNSRAPLIARDYGYTGDEAAYSPASSPQSPVVRHATGASGYGNTYGHGYAADADDAEAANNDYAYDHQDDRYSPSSTASYARPTLVTSHTDMPLHSAISRVAPTYDRPARASSPLEDLTLLPPEGPQDAYVSQHLTPLAPLPSRTQPSSTLPPDAESHLSHGQNGKPPTGANPRPGVRTTADSPPAASPVFARSNTAPGLPQPSATQPLSPGIDAVPAIDAAGNTHSQLHGGSSTRDSDSMPIFHILDAHLDPFSASTVDKLKNHLDAVARMQDEVCGMHLRLEGLAPLEAIRVDSGSAAGDGPGVDGVGIGVIPDKSGASRGPDLFPAKSHDPGAAASAATAPTPSHFKSSKGRDAAAPASASASNPNRESQEEAAEVIARRERGVEEIMNKLGALSDQIRAYHHLGTPKLAFHHGGGSGSGSGSQPVSAHPTLGTGETSATGGQPPSNRAPYSSAAVSTSASTSTFDPISPVFDTRGGAWTGTWTGIGGAQNGYRHEYSGGTGRGQSRADAAANLLRPSPVIVPPTQPGTNSTSVPVSPEWHTRRLAALHAHDLPPSSNTGNPFSPSDKHKPKHPSHLDQVYTARRESSYASASASASASGAGAPLETGDGDGSTPPVYDDLLGRDGQSAGRGGGGVARKRTGSGRQGEGAGDVSPKSTTAERFFSGFGTGVGTRRQNSGSSAGARMNLEKDVKGDQSWVESRS